MDGKLTDGEVLFYLYFSLPNNRDSPQQATNGSGVILGHGGTENNNNNNAAIAISLQYRSFSSSSTVVSYQTTIDRLRTQTSQLPPLLHIERRPNRIGSDSIVGAVLLLRPVVLPVKHHHPLLSLSLSNGLEQSRVEVVIKIRFGERKTVED